MAYEVSDAPAGARDGHAALDRRADLVRALRDGDPRHGPQRDLADRLAGGDRHRLLAHQGADHRRARRPHPRGARRGQDRARRRLPGRLRRQPRRHDARARRLGHDRGRDRRRAGRRRLRDLHRRRAASSAPIRGSSPDARLLPYVSFEEMLEMAASGAGVLQLRSVEYARNHGIRIHCRSSFEDGPGTLVLAEEDDDGTTLGDSRDARRRGARDAHRPPRRARRRGAGLRRPRRRQRQRRHDHPERAGLRPTRRRTSRSRSPATTCRRRPRRSAGLEISETLQTDDRSRQGLDRRRRDAQPPGRRRQGLPDPRRERDQHRDDLHLADQDLVRDRRRSTSREAVRALHEAFDLGADAVLREEPTGGEHRPRVRPDSHGRR